MSQADIERFVADLKSNPELLDEVKQVAGGLGSVVDLAQGKGYDVTLDEAKGYISAQAGQELTDTQLDAVAGGKGHHSTSAVTSQTTVQTTENVTTAWAAAEAVAVIILT